MADFVTVHPPEDIWSLKICGRTLLALLAGLLCDGSSWKHQLAALIAVAAQLARDVGLAAYKQQITVIINRLNSAPTLASISSPTLVLFGQQDMMKPLNLKRAMSDDIEGDELELIEDSGYFSTLERPDGVSTPLRRWSLAMWRSAREPASGINV